MDDDRITIFQNLIANAEASVLSVDGKHPAATATVGKLRQFITIQHRRRMNRRQIAACHCVFQACFVQCLFDQIVGRAASFHCVSGCRDPSHILAVTGTAITQIHTLLGNGSANQAECYLDRACSDRLCLRCKCSVLESCRISSLLGLFLYGSGCSFGFGTTAAATLFPGNSAGLIVTAPAIGGGFPGMIRNRYSTACDSHRHIIQVSIVGFELGQLDADLVTGLTGILDLEGQGTHDSVTHNTGGQGIVPGKIDVTILGVANGTGHNRAVFSGYELQFGSIVGAFQFRAYQTGSSIILDGKGYVHCAADTTGSIGCGESGLVRSHSCHRKHGCQKAKQQCPNK